MERVNRLLSNFIKKNTQLVILLLLFIVFSIILPTFLTSGNIRNILKQNTTVCIASVGLALVVISGNLDLSIGSLLSLTLGVSLRMTQYNTFLAFAVPLVIAVCVGFINGYIVSKFDVNSIIVTLGTLSAIAGFVQFYRKGNIVMGIPGMAYSAVTDAAILTIPSSVIVYFVIAIICQILLTRTLFGRKISYLGINKEAAVSSGINVKYVTVMTFILCSSLVGVASVLQGARLLQGSTNTGQGLEFDALTAILIGGVRLGGGKGTIFNALVGVFILGIIINALTLLNIPFEWRNIAKGILILIAISADAIARWKYEK